MNKIKFHLAILFLILSIGISKAQPLTQLSHGVPNYIFAEDARILVALKYDRYEDKVMKSNFAEDDQMYKAVLSVVKQDIEDLGIKASSFEMATTTTYESVKANVKEWDVLILVSFESGSLKGKVKRDKIGTTYLKISRTRATSDATGKHLYYTVGGRNKSNRLTYSEAIEKFKSNISKVPEGYFVKSISEAVNTPFIPLSADTVAKWPDDLDKSTLLVCRFRREDSREFKKPEDHDWVVKKLQNKYPFEIKFCEILDYEIEAIKSANIKYMLKVKTVKVGVQKYPDITYLPGDNIPMVYHGMAHFYIAEISTGKLYYIGSKINEKTLKVVLNPVGAAGKFCKLVKEQYGLK